MADELEVDVNFDEFEQGDYDDEGVWYIIVFVYHKPWIKTRPTRSAFCVHLPLPNGKCR